MANGRFILGKQSGGTLGLVFPDGISNTEVMLPESGNLVSVDTAVTDNSIARYDGATGKLQDSGVVIGDNGNLLLTSGTGALGYGAGAGGTVTQLTSKSTNVTLNKPCGKITMHNAALAAGATISFILFNNLMGASDTLTLSIPNLIENDIYKYRVTSNLYNGGAIIFVTNTTGGSLSEGISINFILHKGALA